MVWMHSKWVVVAVLGIFSSSVGPFLLLFCAGALVDAGVCTSILISSCPPLSSSMPPPPEASAMAVFTRLRRILRVSGTEGPFLILRMGKL